jgi:hypothetical protein
MQKYLGSGRITEAVKGYSVLLSPGQQVAVSREVLEWSFDHKTFVLQHALARFQACLRRDEVHLVVFKHVHELLLDVARSIVPQEAVDEPLEARWQVIPVL